MSRLSVHADEAGGRAAWASRRRHSRRLPSPGFLGGLRKQAFEEFLALPVPSQETEEWRYTDLEGFDF